MLQSILSLRTELFGHIAHTAYKMLAVHSRAGSVILAACSLVLICQMLFSV